MILRNGRLGERLVDVRIEGGRIVGLGAGLSGAGPGGASPVVDLDGRWLLPGLWDEHVHFTQWTLTSRRVDLAAAESARQAATMAGAAIANARADGILVGANFRHALWADSPSRELLDATTGTLPTVLVSGDLHAAWLNSAALHRFGRPEHPSGLLSEDDAFAVHQQLGTMPPETIDRWARDAAQDAAARGVVGIVDLEMTWNLGDWRRRIAAGHDGLRVEFGIYTEHLDRAIAEGLHTGQVIDELLSVGRFKVLTDGSLNTRTAYTMQHYEDGSHGLLTVPPQTLLPLMRTAQAAGILSSVHAIGDAANTLALDAFEQLGVSAQRGPRGRIEHAQLLTESDYPRFAALGVQASVQPEHALDDRDVADRHWPDRTGRMYAFRSLLDAGAQLVFGSDAPVTPLDPWRGIAAAVTRTSGGREPWHPEQAITVDEALAASSRSRVAVGQPADLVVAEADPRSADGETLRTMPVAATLLAGRFTHRRL